MAPRPVHHTPRRGRAGDVIPFFGGPAGQPPRFHVLYLKTPQDAAEEAAGGTAWHHLVSDDAVSWTDLGEAIGRGAPSDQDASVATGSVIERDGVFHAFYTGFSVERRKAGLPEQGVLHATSTDLLTWTKDTAFRTLNAPPDRYDPHDWRDPHVFHDEEAGEYRMLVAGRHRTGPAGRSGVLALYGSSDLVGWEPRGDFLAPNECQVHECPDLFRMGGWWYLLYSTFSDRQVTRYRRARTLSGPWLSAPEDALDDAGLYAAKTVSDGHRRYLVGWCPTTDTGTDDGTWQWGGTIITHELLQRPDRTLGARVPEGVVTAAGPVRPAAVEPVLGRWTVRERGAVAELGDAFGWCRLGPLPPQGSARLRITPSDGVFELGVGLHVDGGLDSGYLVRIRPGLGVLELDRFPRPAYAGVPHARPLPRRPPGGAFELTLVWSGQTVVACVDDTVLTARTHATGGDWGLFAAQGRCAFELL
ncbi:family 43 glycosylhydrolase [Allostreptomyces psammosilenae]|uniref:beta-fructofuranosidase n=1 Tax=Allostreptomyces psammosilenae TaxID=1892865 RepID=A0A852ZYT7_9ACTN|nr:family 43 glycosylhydrolase [Allostreptomyces psammosilenae]NYI03771.1 beta-fructofuranosidase [Allostreptomyces psammosilenae]